MINAVDCALLRIAVHSWQTPRKVPRVRLTTKTAKNFFRACGAGFQLKPLTLKPEPYTPDRKPCVPAALASGRRTLNPKTKP